MGRLAAKTEGDREVQRHLAAAASSVRKALAVVSQSRSQDATTQRRIKTITQRLRMAVSILEGTGTMQPGWDITDPDLLPEAQKGKKGES